MAELIKSSKACAVYPLKMSQPLGAVYAILGVKNSMPIMHGSQGCAAFAKTFLTRHFWENIPMQTTALSEIVTIMGNDENLHTALKNVIEKNKPEFVGVVSTGVSETRGDDTEGSIKRFREIYDEYSHTKIVFVSTPDYVGSFHEGYSKAVSSILRSLLRAPMKKNPNQINLLISYSMTAKDIDAIEELVKSFGFKPVIFPDIRSLDGQAKAFSSITKYGTDIRDIEMMPASTITIAIGESVKDAGEYLEKKFMIPMFYYDSLIGLENFDSLISLLINLSRKEPPESLKRWRDRLLDAMVDSHFYLTGKKVVMAGEPDFLWGMANFLTKEMGAEVSLIVSPTYTDGLENLPVGKVIIGDLEDILLHVDGSDIDLLIGNTNLRHIAKEIKAPHYRVGIPIFDRLGHFLKGYIGYEGTANLVFELANLLMERDEEASYHIPEYIKRR